MSTSGNGRAPADRSGSDRERFDNDDSFRLSLSVRQRSVLRNALNSATINTQLDESKRMLQLINNVINISGYINNNIDIGSEYQLIMELINDD